MARLMVVDDAELVLQRIVGIVAELGHEVITASGGQQAVELYEAHKPDAVFMDIEMPAMDGLQALEMIRALDPGARVAMVSAHDEQSIVVRAIQLGAMDFVVKPLKRERIIAALRKLLATT